MGISRYFSSRGSAKALVGKMQLKTSRVLLLAVFLAAITTICVAHVDDRDDDDRDDDYGDDYERDDEDEGDDEDERDGEYEERHGRSETRRERKERREREEREEEEAERIERTERFMRDTTSKLSALEDKLDRMENSLDIIYSSLLPYSYRITKNKGTFQEVRQMCRESGGDLFHVSFPATGWKLHGYIRKVVSQHIREKQSFYINSYYIGMLKENQEWKLLNEKVLGTSKTSNNLWPWAARRPNNRGSCAAYINQVFRPALFDVPCTYKYYGICEEKNKNGVL